MGMVAWDNTGKADSVVERAKLVVKNMTGPMSQLRILNALENKVSIATRNSANPTIPSMSENFPQTSADSPKRLPQLMLVPFRLI
jgi:hypothetical protein